MSKKTKSTKLDKKLDILDQTRDRQPMPRPAVFRDRKKYDRNAAKDAARKERDYEKDTDRD